MKSVKHQRRGGATTAGFALQIVNTPGRPARQGSTDELAALGLDGLACLVVGCINQGEASLRIREQTLYNRGILMEGVRVHTTSLIVRVAWRHGFLVR
jgi:hypothetical protein